MNNKGNWSADLEFISIIIIILCLPFTILGAFFNFMNDLATPAKKHRKRW